MIAAEDVLIFVNAAVTATGQHEFRSGARARRRSARREDRRPGTVPVRRHHRMVKRAKAGKGVAATRCRFLPLHLAMEGYLALHFSGSSITWDEWSQQAVRQVLSPRAGDALSRTERPGARGRAARLRRTRRSGGGIC
ncbi:ARPP-2 domain-containing protein [Streptomyces scopuliridis]